MSSFVEKTCPKCQGQGTIITHLTHRATRKKCPRCGGAKTVPVLARTK